MTGDAGGFEMRPIGWVRGGRAVVEDDDWGSITSRIELDPAQFGADEIAGLEAFSHVEVVFVFDRVDPDSVCRGARRRAIPTILVQFREFQALILHKGRRGLGEKGGRSGSS